MVSRLLELSTGCRLHFGLLELAEGHPNRYGGLGLMLETPQLRLRLHAHPDQSSPAVLAPTVLAPTVEIERRIQLAQQHALSVLATRYGLAELTSPGAIEVIDCPPMHSGLGVGTQLGTAVAHLTALAVQERFLHDHYAHENEVAYLAWLSGRGKRSAIGLHGFLQGGLVRDLGYVPEGSEKESSSRRELTVRPVQTESIHLPTDWMVVLCCSRNSGDVHGKLEDQLIDRAATQANPNRKRMLMLSQDALSAAASDDFTAFVHCLNEYMELAARLFASVQNGRYRDAQTASRVKQMQAAGLGGVGQSSWGPTVFGFAPNAERAQAAADYMVQKLDSSTDHIVVTRPKSQGAQWSTCPSTSATGRQHAG